MNPWLYPFVPTAIRIQGRRYFSNLALDTLESLSGAADPEVPPRHLNIAGEGHFREVGKNNRMLCQKLGRLGMHDRVVDVGCGIGRTALALKDLLESPGSYLGIDVIKFAIRWCRGHIRSDKAEFRFVHADVANRMYNPGGRLRPEDYQFPVPSADCTFVLATSLFTHLPPVALEHYVAECSRILRPGGTLLATWFLLDKETLPHVRSCDSRLSFPFEFENHSFQSDLLEEQAVAYKREFVERLLLSHSFVLESALHGTWSGAAATVDSFQDVTVARRLA
jgi:SAM-dependent methyltransferase